MLLEIVDLTHEITRRTSGNSGNGRSALKVRAVADRARRRDARSAGLGQGLALCDASFRHIRHELRPGVAMFELLYIGGDLDDTLPDRFSAAIFRKHIEHTGNLRRRHRVGFDDLDYGLRLERR